ncbi:M20/M25/M40 family metallo-hydrolase [Inhella sp.]|uniref:M20/M25/M40 family metallo-hydrolase n=1 Tax=Inhella sp. TaxID=1921806 RepID=UPI0035B452CB
MTHYEQLDAWIAAHFDEQVQFLQRLVQVPTDTPPGDNAPHARHTAALLAAMGLQAEAYPVPEAEVCAQGMVSITNLIVRQRFGTGGPTVALNAHGDVVPPGEGWTRDPYGGEIVEGRLYGRAAAVSKSDFATYAFALRALQSLALPLAGTVELHFTYDEEFGGELGPGWLLRQGLTKPDWLIAAGFSYQVVTAHNGCLQMELELIGQSSHAAYPDSGVDALQAATDLLQALYGQNAKLRQRRSEVAGISHPYLNVGRIEGGTNTNVVPGRVTMKLDRRMIPEEDEALVEAELRQFIEAHLRTHHPRVQLKMRRLLLARSLKRDPRCAPLVQAVQHHAQQVLGEAIPEVGTPLYTDVRLYAAAGVPAIIYGAGPRTVLESQAKRADEHLCLTDLQAATRVVARTLLDLLTP